MFRRSAVLTSFLFPIVLLSGGCENSTGPNGRGLTLLLTDAPGDFHSAVVTISEVYLQGEGGRTVLLDEPVTYDLLELRSNLATLVQGLDVPEGRYQELRIVVDGAYIEVEQEDGTTKIYATSADYEGLPAGAQVAGELRQPSWSSSGLKIKLPGDKLDVGDGEVIVLIDFDVSESFGHDAGANRWVMHPVVRATDVTFGGHVLAQVRLNQGVVLPQLGGQNITLAALTARLTPAGGGADRDVVLSDSNNDGVFEAMFKGIVPGTYNLSFVLPTGLTVTFDVALPVAVEVGAGETETKVFVVTAASGS
jgi:hypothetical protein